MNSLKNQEEFDRVFNEGRRSSGRYLSVIVRRNVSESRIGIIVNKKFGTAVIRNRAKRVIRQAFNKLIAKTGDVIEIVVIPRTNAGVAGTSVILNEMESLISGLTKAGL